MDSNAASRTGITPSECQVYTFLGGKPDQTVTAAYAVHVLIIVLSSIACPLTTVLNLLVIISVKRKPQLKTISNTVLGCLAVTDALIGMIGLPLFVTTRILIDQAETSSDFCAVKNLSRNMLLLLRLSTVFHAIVMNVERYIAIKHPFQHITIVTKSRVLRSSALAWIVVLFITLPQAITNNSVYITINSTLMLFSMVVIIYCQVVVCCETRRQEKLIAAQQVSVEAKKKFLKEKKAFKVTTTVLVALVISYLPSFLVGILLKMSVLSTNVAASLLSSSIFVFLLNSLTNPIIYCVRTRQFRVAFIEILLGKTNAQAEELERRVFGSANNNVNNNNNNNDSQSHSNADNNISNNDITDSENNNNGNNNSDDNKDNNNDNNSDNDNVNNNNNSDDNKDNNDDNNSDSNNVNNNNNNSDDQKDNNDDNNSDNNNVNNNNSDDNKDNNDGNNSDDNNVNNNNNNGDDNKDNNDGNNSDDNNLNNNNNNGDDNKDNNDGNNSDDKNNNSDDSNDNNDSNSSDNRHSTVFLP